MSARPPSAMAPTMMPARGAALTMPFLAGESPKSFTISGRATPVRNTTSPSKNLPAEASSQIRHCMPVIGMKICRSAVGPGGRLVDVALDGARRLDHVMALLEERIRRGNIMLRRSLLTSAIAAPMVVRGHAAEAQAAWPAKTVRFIVPFAPGGGTDTVSRLICDQLGRAFGQQFVVDNKGGAGGNIGTAELARATPD